MKEDAARRIEIVQDKLKFLDMIDNITFTRDSNFPSSKKVYRKS